ncbi:MAG: phosphate ABC transporter permease PstA [Clostridia bacterium]|nr:phosphate ABC transporter permease PstA [Clostridia bacterium]
MEYINKLSIKQKLNNYKKHPFSALMCVLVWLSAIITIFVLLFIVAYILYKGVPNLKLELFEFNYTSENVSMMPAIINTVTMVVLTLVIAVPIGVFSAVYLVEYAKRGNKLVSAIRLTTETLQGIPSIVFGLFGYLFFNITLGWRYSILSGAITLSLMVLPLIMRTTEEALISVPDSYREGSFGLGAGRLRTIFRVVLPCAVPGILSGVILAVGRIVGETAALIYTSGTVTGIPTSVMDSGRTLSVHMYALLNEGLYTNEAYATAVVLMLLVLIINWMSNIMAKKLQGGK